MVQSLQTSVLAVSFWKRGSYLNQMAEVFSLCHPRLFKQGTFPVEHISHCILLQGLYLDVQLQRQHLDNWLQNVTCLLPKDMPVAVSGLCNVCKRALGGPHPVTKVQEYACKAGLLSQFVLSGNCHRHMHRCAPVSWVMLIPVKLIIMLTVTLSVFHRYTGYHMSLGFSCFFFFL